MKIGDSSERSDGGSGGRRRENPGMIGRWASAEGRGRCRGPGSHRVEGGRQELRGGRVRSDAAGCRRDRVHLIAAHRTTDDVVVSRGRARLGRQLRQLVDRGTGRDVVGGADREQGDVALVRRRCIRSSKRVPVQGEQAVIGRGCGTARGHLATVRIRTTRRRIGQEDQVPAAAGVGVGGRVAEAAQVEDTGLVGYGGVRVACRRVHNIGTIAVEIVAQVGGRRARIIERRIISGGQCVHQLDEEAVGVLGRAGCRARPALEAVSQRLVDRDRIVLHAVLVQQHAGGVDGCQAESGVARRRRAGSDPDVRVLPVGHGGIRVAEVDDVDDELAELRQLLGRVDRIRRENDLEELVGVGDPLLPDRLVAVVRDGQGVVEIDLLIAVGQRGGWQVRGLDPAQAGEAGVGSIDCATPICIFNCGRRTAAEPRVVLKLAAGVIVGPDEVVRLPGIRTKSRRRR